VKESRQDPQALRGVEGKAIEALYKNNEIIVTLPESKEELNQRGYGEKEDSELKLTFYEALYLRSKGVIEVHDRKTKKHLDFLQILNKYKSIDPNAWAKYLIYRDLRSRGYVAREGFGRGVDFRVYERGEYGAATATYLTYSIQEGQPVTVEDLGQAIRFAHSQKKQLVLTVLNRRGEVVYYSLGQLALKKKPVED
jgi:tRNA-intron endonuclease